MGSRGAPQGWPWTLPFPGESYLYDDTFDDYFLSATYLSLDPMTAARMRRDLSTILAFGVGYGLYFYADLLGADWLGIWHPDLSGELSPFPTGIVCAVVELMVGGPTFELGLLGPDFRVGYQIGL